MPTRMTIALVALLTPILGFTQDVNSQLIEGARNGQTEKVETLLKAGADPNAREEEGGRTALMIAAVRGHRPSVLALLNAGADVNARSGPGITALMAASGEGQTLTVKVLLDAGANVNTSGRNITALMMAALKGVSSTVQALVDAGANVNARAEGGTTALMMATDEGYSEVVRILRGAGAKEAGAEEVEDPIQKKIEEALAYYQQATSYMNQKDYDQAITHFTKAIELIPVMSQAYAQRGFARLQKREFELAISDSTKAIELAPDDPVPVAVEIPLVNRGSAYANMGRYDQAITDFTKAIELDPTLAQAYVNLGAVYQKTGNVRQSAEAYEKAFKFGLSDATLFNNVAWLFATTTDSEIRNPEKAIEYASKAVEATQGRNPGFLDTLAEAYYASNDFEKAIQTIQQAIALQPNESYYKEQLIKFQEGGQAKPND